MRVTMKSLCALPTGALEPGRTYDVPTARGKSLVAGGYAVPADEDPATGGKRKPARKKARSRKAPAKPVSGEDEAPQNPDEETAEESGDGSDEGDED